MKKKEFDFADYLTKEEMARLEKVFREVKPSEILDELGEKR
jgi:hypothetical protein